MPTDIVEFIPSFKGRFKLTDDYSVEQIIQSPGPILPDDPPRPVKRLQARSRKKSQRKFILFGLTSMY